MNMKVRSYLCTAALLAAGSGAMMADGGTSSSGSSSGSSGVGVSSGSMPAIPVDRFGTVRSYIAAKRWPNAIEELQKIADPRDADWNNLMGYCARRSNPPDLAAAERHYQAALAINPKHLGTLEYLGEMRLQQGNLRGAETELDALRKATFFKSREYKELEQAIAQFKTSGNHFIPED
jgi:hypothetical protein